MTRLPVVAGSFYEGSSDSLLKRLENCFINDLGPGRIPEGSPGNLRNLKSVVVPHAGYVYSGMPAAHTYLRMFEDGQPEHIIIIGPNHTGLGDRVAVCNNDWQTPLGIVKYDTTLGDVIISENDYATADCFAHSREHSIEVQLPFLQFTFGEGLSFVPICMGDQSYHICESLGKTIAHLAEDMDILVIASSDFTHFESADSARKKDNQALEFLEYMNPKGFLQFVQQHRISICGAGPITTAMVFAMERGASEFKLLKYTNSGDITGDKNNVVAYVAAEIL
jgi:AmmeMemoRadiSam system protein B